MNQKLLRYSIHKYQQIEKKKREKSSFLLMERMVGLLLLLQWQLSLLMVLKVCWTYLLLIELLLQRFFVELIQHLLHYYYYYYHQQGMSPLYLYVDYFQDVNNQVVLKVVVDDWKVVLLHHFVLEILLILHGFQLVLLRSVRLHYSKQINKIYNHY